MPDKIFLNKNPKVSIITVCFNSEKHIGRAVESLLVQTYDNIEYIVIDGGSTDATLKILDKYKKRIACLISEPDRGIYDAMNKGIKCSTGEVVYFLNSDDRLYDKDVVQKIIDFFSAKDIDFVYGNIVNCYSDNSASSIGMYPRFITKRHFIRNTIGHPATFFRKSCFEKAGIYDIQYKIVSDYEWYLRALYKYHMRCAHIDEIVSIFHCSGASMTEVNNVLILAEREHVQKLYFKPIDLWTGKFLNFFLYLDFIRFAARLILGKKGYEFFLKFRKKAGIHG